MRHDYERGRRERSPERVVKKTRDGEEVFEMKWVRRARRRHTE